MNGDINAGINMIWFKVFKGIFVSYEMSRDISCIVTIKKNKLKLFSNLRRVKMNSTEFEKYFDVYVNKNIDINQIISSDVMQLLVDFYKKYRIKFEVTLKHNKIYIRLPIGTLFKPKVFSPLFRKRELYRYYLIIKEIKTLIENLKIQLN